MAIALIILRKTKMLLRVHAELEALHEFSFLFSTGPRASEGLKGRQYTVVRPFFFFKFQTTVSLQLHMFPLLVLEKNSEGFVCHSFQAPKALILLKPRVFSSHDQTVT